MIRERDLVDTTATTPSDQTPNHPVSRRTLFGAGASMLQVTGSVATVAKAKGLDRDLLAACDELQDVVAYMDAMPNDVPDDVTEAVCQRHFAAVASLAGMTAVTPQGVRAMADAACVNYRWQVRVSLLKTWEEQATVWDLLTIRALGQAGQKF